MIKEYWNLIGRQPFLAITRKSDFSQACSSRKMLRNHKNFHFTQIPDKNNDVIFLKSPKTLFFSYFLPFLVIFARWGFFPKIRLCHTQLYRDPWHHAKFQKKLMRQFRESLRTDGRTDGQTQFFRTLPAEAGGPKIFLCLICRKSAGKETWRKPQKRGIQKFSRTIQVLFKH